MWSQHRAVQRREINSSVGRGPRGATGQSAYLVAEAKQRYAGAALAAQSAAGCQVRACLVCRQSPQPLEAKIAIAVGVATAARHRLFGRVLLGGRGRSSWVLRTDAEG